MGKNLGFKNELDIIDAINKKRYFQLNNNWKYNLKIIFGKIHKLQKIKAEKCPSQYSKPDIFVQYKEKKIYISIKSGYSNTVHEEYLETFLQFLRENGISDNTIETIILFQYGDGTLDGSGDKRLPYSELMPKLMDRISIANKELNSSKNLLESFINRVVLDGNKNYAEKVDYIYHGNAELGILCSREKILMHVLSKNYNHLENLHIGPILFSPYARYVNFNDIHPQKRRIVQFKWPNFVSDLEYISRRYQ